LVQVLQKFGPNPNFKTNIDKWSKDLHCVVEFMKKKTIQQNDKKRAQVCLEILFNPKKTEHYGSFIRCEHGTKTNFENMTHYAIPLVILTWHRMIQEYFWKNDKKSFFQHGNYMPRKQRFPKDTLGLFMIDSTGKETHITSFNMIHHNTDTDVAQHACLSLLEWAKYLLEPNEELDNDNDLNMPMTSYKITDDEIDWKKDTDTNTRDNEAIASVTEEDSQWDNIDFNVENKTAAELRYNIAQALELTHSRYRNLKRVNKTQQDEKDIIEQGMLSIMQMHSNATGTAEAKSWKTIYSDISALHHEELNSNKLTDSVINEAPKKPTEDPKHATFESDDDDDDEDSDYSDTGNYNKKKNLLFPDGENSNDNRKQNALFDDGDESDEEKSDDPDRHNTPGKESGHDKIVGIDSQNAAATDNEITESGKEATNDVSDKSDQEPDKSDAENTKKKKKITTINDVGVEPDHESATKTKSKAANIKKRVANDDSQNDKGKKNTRAKKN
jgi:hypothetical protein